MRAIVSQFSKNQSGATAIEYGMIAALIAAAIITSLQMVGTALNAKFLSISTQLN